MTDVGSSSRASTRRGDKGMSPVARLRLFIKQILDELRKVVPPTRSELLNYTAVVIVFVTFMMAMTATLDFGFSKLVALVFGN
ncbi:preprotein translocase subunit SecE [Nostocoides jenkinsii]|nr:preprotein translocase subunit SecE [Tetrasphaera jenkinsii]